MNYLNIVSTENANITELAQAQFFIEDKLEREFHRGFISEEEYNEGVEALRYASTRDHKIMGIYLSNA